MSQASGNIESDVIYVIPLSLSYHIFLVLSAGIHPTQYTSSPRQS